MLSGGGSVPAPNTPTAWAGLVEAWLPGSEGTGVADTLFGVRPFTGRLPVSWPRTLAEEPINVGDRHYDPLFPYGYGLRTHTGHW